MGGEPVGVRRSCFGFALLAPECIAGSVKKDEPSLGIGIGHRGVGLTANQARVWQGSFNADPPYPLRGRKRAACQRRNAGKVARGYKAANPRAQLMVFHTVPNSKKEATERLTILMRGCTRPHSGPASNRQDTRHSGLRTMLEAEQPDKLLAHLSGDHVHEPHNLNCESLP